MNKSLYIHIPYCHSICSYCDFIKVFYNSSSASLYLKRIEEELKESKELYKTIYIGGGSPSSLSYEQLNSLLTLTSKYLDKDYEFTIEVNPEDMDEGKIKLLKLYGVNRVSIGVQTFNDRLLNILNRKHCKEDVFDLIASLRFNGIENISIDLMYGLPGQGMKDLKNDLNIIRKLHLPHISTYALLIEDHTCFKVKGVEALGDDEQAKMYDYIYKYLTKYGYNRYEVSNYALKGKESKHNLTYWEGREYKGVGASSSGYENNVRYTNTKSLTDYLNGKNEREEEYIDDKDGKIEYIILHLRLENGFSLDEYQNIFKTDFLEEYKDEIKELLDRDMIEINKRIYVKKEKMFILNQVLCYFIK